VTTAQTGCPKRHADAWRRAPPLPPSALGSARGQGTTLSTETGLPAAVCVSLPLSREYPSLGGSSPPPWPIPPKTDKTRRPWVRCFAVSTDAHALF